MAKAHQAPIRVIFYFQRNAVASPELNQVLTSACQCQPIFFRPYMGNALIYEIALPEGYSFAAFEQAFLARAEALGITALELDAVMQTQ